MTEAATLDSETTDSTRTDAIPTEAPNAPVALRDNAGNVLGIFRIDSVVVNDGTLEVRGWNSGMGTLQVSRDGEPVSVEGTEVPLSHLSAEGQVNVPDGARAFLMRLPFQSGDHALQWLLSRNGTWLEHKVPLAASTSAASAPSPSAGAESVLGWFEVAAATSLTGDGIVAGWALHPPDTLMWVETENGRRFYLHEGYRCFRQDVHDTHRAVAVKSVPETGFLVRLQDTHPGQKIRLFTQYGAGGSPILVKERVVDTLPSDAVAAARWLFGIQTPRSDLHNRLACIDVPLIERLIQEQQRSWTKLPTTVRDVGTLPAAPMASVIIPLYGRTDFVEHQLLEFIKDDWLKHNAEIVYVVDDPNVIETFRGMAERLHRLYGLPFRWVFGACNRGFSGANNLGVQHSRGEYLVFLNSDAFPQRPGWLQQMVETLATYPNYGAVGPRLVFADGSIQHASMQFLRREELGVWINHHPQMGLDPEFDAYRETSAVPAVTGACMAVRRVDLDRVGGWDTGYLIGDFEDSDLCLKLRDLGYQIGYIPSVQLTHLERQSFKLLGESDFRSQVVLFNAVRHQTHWAHVIGGRLQ